MLMEFTQRKRPLIEICCCSTDDAMQAYLGGADRSVDIFQFSDTPRAKPRGGGNPQRRKHCGFGDKEVSFTAKSGWMPSGEQAGA